MNVASPSSDVTRCSPPINLDPADTRLFGDGVVPVTTRQVRTLGEVDVFGRGPLRTSDGRYLVESFVNQDHYDTWRRERGHWRTGFERVLARKTRMESPAVWITDNWSCGYYHWFADALPRLEVVVRQVPAADLVLLLPNKFRRHQYFIDSLQPFGLKDVKTLDRFEHIRCRELLFPSHLVRTGYHDREILQSLRRTFRAVGSGLETGPAYERLYISRQKATRRCVANEKQILPVLADHGFQTVVAEELSWQRQVELVRSAKYLVSNHGAGLTNMLMMRSGSSVLEIRELTDSYLNCYFTMANALDLKYFYLLAQRSNPREKTHFADLVVDPGGLDSVIRQMLSDDGLRTADSVTAA